MARNHGIIAYGEHEDRLRLAAVAKALGHRSASDFLVATIRAKYLELFGDLDPKLAGERRRV
jgi:hypothetical protein